MKFKGVILAFLGVIVAPAYGSESVPKTQGEIQEKLEGAVQVGDITVVAHLLDSKADVNGIGKDLLERESILFKAADAGHVEVVKLLLDRRALVDVGSVIYRITPLSRAVFNSDLPIIKVLLKHKANPAIESLNGPNALCVSTFDKNHLITALLLQDPGVDLRAILNAYVGRRDKETTRLYLNTVRSALYHADKQARYTKVLASTPLAPDTAGVVATYAGHYHPVSGYELGQLLDKKPTDAELKEAREAVALAGEIYSEVI